MVRGIGIASAIIASCAALSGCSVLSPVATASPAATSSHGTPNDVADASFPPIADAAITSCSGGNGLWRISGSVRNPTKSPFLYSVVVALVSNSGQTLDEIVADPGAQVGPGSTHTWKATASGEPASTVGCRVGAVDRVQP